MAVSKRLRFEVLRRDGHTCRYCGGQSPDVKLQVDHVIPVSLGGTDTPDNLVAACKDCNSGKSSASPGSQLIADVSADALRWAKARKFAAEDADQACVDAWEMDAEYEAAFESQWQLGGIAVPVDDNWRERLSHFRKHGLPLNVMVACAYSALCAYGVSDFKRFSYFCKCCLNRLEDIDRRTLEILAKADS